MKDKEIMNIRYIEVTEKRYNHVKTEFKYENLDGGGNRHYHLARNRMSLQNKGLESKV